MDKERLRKTPNKTVDISYDRRYNNNMEKVLTLADIKNSVASVAKTYGIKRVTLFGSYANGKATNESDIDLLVEFNTRSVSFYKICELKVILEEMTGKSVDVLHAPLSKNTLLDIDKEVVLYAA